MPRPPRRAFRPGAVPCKLRSQTAAANPLRCEAMAAAGLGRFREPTIGTPRSAADRIVKLSGADCRTSIAPTPDFRGPSNRGPPGVRSGPASMGRSPRLSTWLDGQIRHTLSQSLRALLRHSRSSTGLVPFSIRHLPVHITGSLPTRPSWRFSGFSSRDLRVPVPARVPYSPTRGENVDDPHSGFVSTFTMDTITTVCTVHFATFTRTPTQPTHTTASRSPVAAENHHCASSRCRALLRDVFHWADRLRPPSRALPPMGRLESRLAKLSLTSTLVS